MDFFNKTKLSQTQAVPLSQKSHTILLVDDEASNLNALARVLGKEYELLLAKDGQEALDLLQNDPEASRVHLIISDQRMPHLTGVEFLSKTLSLLPHTIRMIVTGFTDIDAIINSINLGEIYEFLTKPVSPHDLRVSVRRALEAFELQGRNARLIQEFQELNANLEQKVEERTHALNQTLLEHQSLNENLLSAALMLNTSRKKMENRNQEMKEELVLAGELQKKIFASVPPPPFLKMAHRVLPYSHVSGDIYHFSVGRNDDFNVFLGDATGHGVSAALTTVMAHMQVNKHRGARSPSSVLRLLNRSFGQHLPESRFLTGVYVRVFPDGRLEMCNAGHPPLTVIPADGSALFEFQGPGPPLGLLPDRMVKYIGDSYQLKAGDRFFVYTDCILEVMNANRKIFGDTRLRQLLNELRALDLETMLDQILARLQNYTGGVPWHDDLTMALFEYNPVD